jgi:hypothetical protein
MRQGERKAEEVAKNDVLNIQQFAAKVKRFAPSPGGRIAQVRVEPGAHLVPPSTYTWSITSGSASGTASGDTWTGSSSATGTSFVLKVVATDVDGRKSSDTQNVFVHSGGSY